MVSHRSRHPRSRIALAGLGAAGLGLGATVTARSAATQAPATPSPRPEPERRPNRVMPIDGVDRAIAAEIGTRLLIHHDPNP